jgi:hypothetical protein
MSGTAIATAGAAINFMGNVNIGTGATFNSGNFNHTIDSNFTNNGTYTDAGGSIAFNGNSIQNISGSSTTTFYNLIINNTAGVSLLKSANVNNTLTLTEGPLNLNSKTLTINNNTSSAITRTNGYMVSEKTDNSSKLNWNIGSTIASYTFPFGTIDGTYIPFIFNHTSGDIGNVTVSTYPTAADNTPLPYTPILVSNIDDIHGNDNSVNTVDRFWQIDKDGPNGTATLTFTVTSLEASGIGSLIAQRWDAVGNGWSIPSIYQSNTATSVTIEDVTIFSPWTLTGNSSPLPIELLSFTITKNNNYAALNWVTATEINNYGFDIEKSTDLKSWDKIGFVAGAGNSNRLIQYTYNDLLEGNIKNNNTVIYYRLKQNDFDGAYKYTDVRSLNLNSSNQDIPVIFTLYPNPATQNINITNNQPAQQFEIRIFNQNGSQVGNYLMDGSIRINISDLKPAAYQIIIINKENEKQYQYKLVKIPD